MTPWRWLGLHRAALESIFGLQLQAQTLPFTPCLPAQWPEAELTLVRDVRTLRFVLPPVKSCVLLLK